ncbi:MAG: adenylate/guanylate cyclase domain-containing protein [Actinomycetota bacterium]|nr:adenylate/guanylate cyclase domain-containing protein [Actinomycetota bacterium]
MPIERRTGTITILFTDLVDSTETMERAGEDEGRELLRRYLSRLREIAKAYGGQEVKNFGDGIEVAFSSVVAALDAATTMQRAVHWENRSGSLPIRLRIGMNVCEASIAEGDYWGLSVVVAKRLCDLADAGQILVSGLVPELVSHHREWGFRPMGERNVKGISRTVDTFALVWTPLDHVPTLPLPSSSATPEQKVVSRFIRSVRRSQSES